MESIVKLINVDIMINTISLLSSNSTVKFLCNSAEHTFGGGMHCIQERVFTADIGRGICRKENWIGWEDWLPLGIDGMNSFSDIRLVDCRYQCRGDVTGEGKMKFSRVCWKWRLFFGIGNGVMAAIFGGLDNSCIILFL